MKNDMTDGQMNEQSLVQLYMNLMGTSESHARNVLMYLSPAHEETNLEAGSSILPTERVSLRTPTGQ